MEHKDCSGHREHSRSANKREGEVDWKVQHERRVAERRERTEHERIEAEKLQQVRQDVTIETRVKSKVVAWEQDVDPVRL